MNDWVIISSYERHNEYYNTILWDKKIITGEINGSIIISSSSFNLLFIDYELMINKVSAVNV